MERQSANGACTDAVLFNFENPSLHGHGAQVCTPFVAPHLTFNSPSTGAHAVGSCKARPFDEPRPPHQRELSMGIQQVTTPPPPPPPLHLPTPTPTNKRRTCAGLNSCCSGSISVWNGWLQGLSPCTPSPNQILHEQPEDVKPGQTLVLRSAVGSRVLSRHDLRGHDLGSGARSPLHL
jgi:hypothetical protein